MLPVLFHLLRSHHEVPGKQCQPPRRVSRGLRAIMEEVLDGLMFDTPSDPTITRIVVTKEGIEDKKSFVFERDPLKVPVRMMIPVAQDQAKSRKNKKTFA